jgi:uncharacterized protein YceH (UPF0502 family)
MADDFFAILHRFHREVVLPDIDSRIAEVRQEIGALRSEMLSHFGAVYKRFDRLESEYQALAAAVARLEARSVTRVEFEHAIEDLKARVKRLEQRIVELERES